VRVLCLNGGSSSLKFALYELDAGAHRLCAGAIEGIGTERGRLWARDGGGRPLTEAGGEFADSRAAVHAACAILETLRLPAPDAIGHRIVHGGSDHLFCYQLRTHVGALAAVLGGLDTLVFTGGIGERAAPVRWAACRGLAHLGIRLDMERNAEHAAVISAVDSACTVRVVPTDEELMIARHTRAVLQG